MIYCCQEHVDLGLDDIVDEFAVPPRMEKITDEESHHTCKFCGKKALYKLFAQ